MDAVAHSSKPSRLLLPFVAAVAVAGSLCIVHAAAALLQAPISGYAVLLSLLTLAAGRYRIKVPGYSATVSVSELFVFALALVFGPALATIAVAVDGVSASLVQSNRRWYRTVFNIAEPALSIWVALHAFYAVSEFQPGEPHGLASLLAPTMLLGTVYFIFNSVLTAAAIALECGASVFRVWRQPALYLWLNYHAAACLAALAATLPGGVTFTMIGLGTPLLILSYVAYETASKRSVEAEKHVKDIERLYRATVEAFATAVDVKDQVTHGHIRRVQRHTLAVARALGVDDPAELKAIEAAALLHDVGKLAIPDHVLYKPGPLTAQEYECMKLHAKMGATILASVDFPFPVVPIVRHHHERWDGRGYPDGLSGRAIPLGARILTVVDCFDAVTSDRPYRRQLSDEEATLLLEAGRGTQYDPAVIDAFIAMIPKLRRADADAVAHSAGQDGLMEGMFDLWRRASSLTAEQAQGTLARLRDNAGAVLDRIQRLRPEVEVCVFGVDATETLVLAGATEGIRAMASGAQLQLGHGLSGWVAAYRQPIANSDPRLDFGRTACDALGLHSCAALPIFSAGTLVGVLSVYAPQPRAFSVEEVRKFTVLANELSTEPLPVLAARYQVPA